MANLVILKFPEFKRFFEFVDFEGYILGRMNQEIKKDNKEKSKVEI
jgi:hypothetical protein